MVVNVVWDSEVVKGVNDVQVFQLVSWQLAEPIPMVAVLPETFRRTNVLSLSSAHQSRSRWVAGGLRIAPVRVVVLVQGGHEHSHLMAHPLRVDDAPLRRHRFDPAIRLVFAEVGRSELTEQLQVSLQFLTTADDINPGVEALRNACE